ncbi:NepR family anti-sigma factor [Sphingomonas flavescens]|uniref:NepR family anti-sigma factor n=1 Tax=Sphingomonas flavescens TaxID=3132797 RepID=UPI002803BA25|nr:NepR family anti-sigma factor [Sphingomonas limnosediminicola]
MSAESRSKTDRAGHSGRSTKSPATEKNGRKQRSSDLGRALRSVYDDTLRESVPDDFNDLLGRLS